MKRSWPTIIVGAVLAVILILYMISFQVRFSDVAVVRTFGQIKEGGVIKEPGLYWKWPWPIQKVDTLDRRIQTTSLIGRETMTRDGKNVVLTTTVCWRVSDPYKFSVQCKDMADAANKITGRVQGDQATVLNSYDFSNVFSTDPKELKYAEIEQAVTDTVRKNTEDLYGVKIERVSFESFVMPAKVTEAMIDAMKKERQAKAQQYTSEGESQAKQIRDTADSIAGTILAFADRKAKEIVAEGQERAIKYNETFRKDEDLATFLLKIDNIQKMLGERATLILDEPVFTDLLIPPSASASSPTPKNTGTRVPNSAVPAIIDQK